MKKLVTLSKDKKSLIKRMTRTREGNRTLPRRVMLWLAAASPGGRWCGWARRLCCLPWSLAFLCYFPLVCPCSGRECDTCESP